jgi:hypothetical protein
MTHKHLTLALLSALIAGCSGATDGALDPDKTTTDDGTGSVGAVCGDGIAEGNETCDGSDLADASCADLDGFVSGTLACAADCSAFDTTACEADPAGAVVRINELTSQDVVEGEFSGASDAIELYNAGMMAADLGGFLLSDEVDFAQDKTYVFPPGMTLQPGEFLVLVKLDDATGEGDFPFGISADNEETISLADSTGTVVDAVTFLGPDAQISWCRLPDGEDAWQTCGQTFGMSNVVGDPAACGNGIAEGNEDCDGADVRGLDCTDAGAFTGGTLACDDSCGLDTTMCETDPALPQVAVNEISSDTDEIEFYNFGEETVDLSGWIVTDGIDPAMAYDPMADDGEQYVFPKGTMVDAGEFIVLAQDDTGAAGHIFGLSAGGDSVALVRDDLTFIDFVEYGADEAEPDTFCRIPDGTGEPQTGCTETFGAPNE